MSTLTLHTSNDEILDFSRATESGGLVSYRLRINERGNVSTANMSGPDIRAVWNAIGQAIKTPSAMCEAVMSLAHSGDLTVAARLKNPAVSGKKIGQGRVTGQTGLHARLCVGPRNESVCYSVGWEQIARAYFFDLPVEINN